MVFIVEPACGEQDIIVLTSVRLVGRLVVLGLTALRDSVSVYIGPSPKEREKEKRKDR